MEMQQTSLELMIDDRAGTWGFRVPGILMDGGWPEVEILAGVDRQPVVLRPCRPAAVIKGSRQTPLGPAGCTRLSWEDESGCDFSLTITRLEKLPGFTLQSAFHNRRGEPVRLRNFWLTRSPGHALICEGVPSSWWLQTVNYSRRNGHLGQVFPSIAELTAMKEHVSLGEHEHVKTGERAKDGRWRMFPDFITLYEDQLRGAPQANVAQRGVAMGAVGPAESYVFFDCNVDNGRIQLEIVSEMDDIRVDHGETRSSEEVLVLALPYEEAMTAIFRWIAATHGARTGRGPVFGWCSWYDKGNKVNASSVDAVSASIARNRDRIPIEVIQIDDGWQKDHGDWEPNPERFPDGLAKVAARIREAGAIPGIWMSPSFTNLPIPPGWGHDRGYDITHPDAREHIRKAIAARVCEGFRYFKFDYLFNLVTPRYDEKKTRFQAMRELFRLFRETIGEDSYLLACAGQILRPSIGFADAARTGSDSLPRWTNALACDGVPCGASCFSETIRTLGSTCLSNGILFAVDPDVTYAPEPQLEFFPKRFTLPELRTWHSFVGLLGGFAIFSEPLDSPVFAGPGGLRMLEIMNPPAPDKGRSFLGAVDPHHRQFGFVARRPWGTFASIVLCNIKDDPGDVALSFAGLEALGTRFHVWSFWDEKYLGICDASFAARSLPPHGSALLRLTALSNRGGAPVLVGSNLHVAMGSAELADIEAGLGGLTATLTDAGARAGALWIHSRRPLKLTKALGCEAALSQETGDIWRISINCRERGKQNQLQVVCA